MKFSKGIIALIVVVVILFIIGLQFKSSYNNMVDTQEVASSQWANVQNAYQRRSDLIPNLVNTVKGYATHEQKTLTDVIEARSNATKIQLNPDQLTEENLQKYQEAQGMIGAALGRLLRVQETYPELKANVNFMALQDELAGTENRISVERKKFNEAVKEYNTYIRKFPQAMIAGMFGFKERAYFQASDKAQEAPEVQF